MRTEKMTQEKRLDYLVEEFKTDSVQYKDLETPKDTEGKRRILRSLMNIRMPKAFSDDVLTAQDQYLTGRAEEFLQEYFVSRTSGRRRSPSAPWTAGFHSIRVVWKG